MSYVPGMPTIHLESEVVLLGLLPPLLYAAAIQTSLVDFNANRGSILRLSVVLVVLTSLAVGAVVHWLAPEIGWAAAIAIGAVVAPPDAVAATAVARKIGLPRRVVTILEGESLLNDASALVSLRTAIAAFSGGFALSEASVDFVRAAGGGVLIGVAFFLLIAWLRKRITDPLMDTAISFLTPFAAFVAAEEIHASGVISVVVAGLLLGHKAPIIQTAQSRITERITWRTVAFVLENTVFLLIGLQLDWILVRRLRVDPVGRSHRPRVRGHPGHRDRRTDGLGLPHLAVPPDGRGPAPGVVDLPHRLGRHARRGHPGRGVRHPRGLASTARCCS